MSGRNFGKLSVVFSVGCMLFCSASLAHATVYAWKGERGILILSNDLDDVPEAQRTAMQEFTSKFAGKSAIEVPVPVAPTAPDAAVLNLYERGLDRGLQTAERQVALAGELARTVLTAMPP